MKQNKNIEKANSLLEELNREEKSGFKAEIERELEEQRQNAKSGLTNKSGKLTKSKKSEDEIYEEDFDDIEEDLPQDDLNLSGNNLGMGRGMGESHGITVS